MLSPSHKAPGGLGDAAEWLCLVAVLNGRFSRLSRQSITRILIRATNDSDFYAVGLDPNYPCQNKQPDYVILQNDSSDWSCLMHCQIILGYFSKFRLLVTIKLIEVRFSNYV